MPAPGAHEVKPPGALAPRPGPSYQRKAMSERVLQLGDLQSAAGFARRLAARLRPGDTVLLSGDLGAGKTTIARTVIETLTGESDIPSPTYTLVQTYETAAGASLAHADLYRVETPDELDELGLEDLFEEAIVLVEWPERLAEKPDDRLEIDLSMEPEGGRRAILTGHGSWERRIGDV